MGLCSLLYSNHGCPHAVFAQLVGSASARRAPYFVVSFISATLLPMGSEPAVFGLVKLNPDLFWPAIAVATVGNTLGCTGLVDRLERTVVVDKYRHSRSHVKAARLARTPGA